MDPKKHWIVSIDMLMTVSVPTLSPNRGYPNNYTNILLSRAKEEGRGCLLEISDFGKGRLGLYRIAFSRMSPIGTASAGGEVIFHCRPGIPP